VDFTGIIIGRKVLEEIKINVLDRGHITLIDMMGSDMRVVQAARVSTGGDASKGEEQDRRLIRYLMKNKHWTPFEKIVFEFHVKCPFFVIKQWLRHRISSFNIASGRYKEFKWECHQPSEWRKQDEVSKQRSLAGFDTYFQEDLDHDMNHVFRTAAEFYYEALHDKVAREQARIVMPLAQYTEFFWTVNFRSLANFITLRTDQHAQKEIQDYANAILKILNSIPEINWTTEIFSDILRLEKAIAKSIEEVDIDETIERLSK
jgi:thymidylate synthase (FAD)